MSLIEMAQEIGLNPKKVAATNGDEYHSACPVCGGKDRFIMHPNKKMKNCDGCYWCRQCGIRGDTIQFGREYLGLSFEDAAKHANAIIGRKPILFIPNSTNIFKPCALKPPSHEWTTAALGFVEYAHQEIFKQPEALKWLNKRGLPQDAVIKYKLGWCPDDIFPERESWGLDYEENENGTPRKIWIPAGLVIPTLDRENVVRLKVRRSKWNEGDESEKYIAISGSMNGLSIIGDTEKPVMIVVESELDAYALHHIVSDFAFIVAVGSNIKNPDIVTDSLAQKTKTLLICYDNDNGGKTMFEKWKKLYPHAIDWPTPIGKDIGEAIEKGFDIKNKLLETIDKHHKNRNEQKHINAKKQR